MGIKIRGIGKALPARTVKNEYFSSFLDTSDEWIVSRTGISERRFLDREAGETLEDLVFRAAEQAVRKSGEDPSRIGMILVATATPDRLMPSYACMLQLRFGLPEGLIAFDLNAACSGFISALAVAEKMAPDLDPARPLVLVAAAEAFSGVLDFADRSSCVLFGDGAGAVLLEYSEEHAFVTHLCASGDCAITLGGAGESFSFLHMEGQKVFRFAVSAIQKELRAIEKLTGKGPEDIDLFLCHQANERILRSVCEKKGIPDEKVFQNLSRYGNTGAASIPIVMAEMEEQGLLETGRNAVMIGFGAGLTSASCYLEL